MGLDQFLASEHCKNGSGSSHHRPRTKETASLPNADNDTLSPNRRHDHRGPLHDHGLTLDNDRSGLHDADMTADLSQRHKRLLLHDHRGRDHGRLHDQRAADAETERLRLASKSQQAHERQSENEILHGSPLCYGFI